MLEFTLLRKYPTDRKFLVKKQYGRSPLDFLRGLFAPAPKKESTRILPKRR